MNSGQTKPLTMGKLVVGVALGVLLAAAIATGLSMAWVEHERSEHAAANIRAETDRQHEASVADIRALEASNLAIEAQIRKVEPGSPCNVLVDEAFSQCASLKGAREKRNFVASMRPASRKSNIAATHKVLVSSKMSNDAPVPLCKDVMKAGSSSYPTCRTE